MGGGGELEVSEELRGVTRNYEECFARAITKTNKSWSIVRPKPNVELDLKPCRSRATRLDRLSPPECSRVSDQIKYRA